MLPMTGLRKTAILLVQMGREASAKVLENLREQEVEEIMAEIIRLPAIEADQVKSVLDEFHNIIQARAFIGQGGFAFAQELLENSLGSDKAKEILNRLHAAARRCPSSSCTTPTPVSCCRSCRTSTRRRSRWCSRT